MKRILPASLIILVAVMACFLPASPAAVVMAIATPTHTAMPTQAHPTATRLVAEVIAYQALNVRQAAGVTSPVIFNLAHGDQVRVLGACNPAGWVHILFEGRRGWVNADYLSEDPCTGPK